MTLAGTTDARADVPPEPGFRYVSFYFSVVGLTAAPEHVLLAYPTSDSGAPSSELTVVTESLQTKLGRRSPDPYLYLVKQAEFEQWRASHPARLDAGRRDADAEALVKGPLVVPCNVRVRVQHKLPTSDPRYVITKKFELVEGNDKSCVVRELSKPEPSSTPEHRTLVASGCGGCTSTNHVSSKSGIALLAAIGLFLTRARRRKEGRRAP
jgi:MYXO-CTERM domain-containing protein